MKGKQLLTKVPPAQPAPWYSKATPCVGCRARLLNRFEKDGDVWIRVLHEESCHAPGVGAARAPVSRNKSQA